MDRLQGVLSLLGRLFLVTIFAGSALGSKIPNFQGTVTIMEAKGVPNAQVMLAGAIIFLLAGSLSVLIGFKARWGALLLAIFLILASYYFHDFWNLANPHEAKEQQIQFMKNLSMLGAMLFIMGNGPGQWSVDSMLERRRVEFLN